MVTELPLNVCTERDFLNEICPDKKTFEAIDRRLREHGTLKPNTRDWGRLRRTRTPQMEEAINNSVDDDPRVSTRQ